MPLDADLLSILACPKCKGGLTAGPAEKSLVCAPCQLSYPVREGVPVLLLEEAASFSGAAPLERAQAVAAGRPGEAVRFVIVEGKNKGEVISLDKGSCRAIGRSLDEMERTRVSSVDFVISLDETSKKLVMGYVSKQFRRQRAASGEEEGLGGFRRGADFHLADGSVSRLHAMLFYDDAGVGILDLVSKNGTFVNGVEVESKILKKGDLITIGGTKLRFEGSA